MPIGARHAPSPDSDSAVGTMPATIATVVITIGWARLCPASMIASNFGTPFSISSSAKSMTRMEFLATIPSSISRPMNTGIDSGCPATCSANAPPSGASSNDPRLTKGGMIRLYSRVSTASTSNMPDTTATAKLVSISICHLASPALIFCTPGTRPSLIAFISGRAFSLAVPWLVTMPGARSAPTTMRRIWL